MRIGVDLDEVLVEFMGGFIKFHNLRYGTSLRKEHFKTYKLWDTMGETKEDVIRKINEFYKTNHFRYLLPTKGAIQGIKYLKEGNDLVIITSRPDIISKETNFQVDMYFPNCFSAIELTNHYAENSRTKLSVCDKHNIDVLIEDNLDYALECVKGNRKVFLLDCPWNQYPNLPKGICRVNSWEDIIKTFKNQ